jgi:hypothetical protein
MSAARRTAGDRRRDRVESGDRAPITARRGVSAIRSGEQYSLALVFHDVA